MAITCCNCQKADFDVHNTCMFQIKFVVGMCTFERAARRWRLFVQCILLGLRIEQFRLIYRDFTQQLEADQEHQQQQQQQQMDLDP